MWRLKEISNICKEKTNKKRGQIRKKNQNTHKQMTIYTKTDSYPSQTPKYKWMGINQ